MGKTYRRDAESHEQVKERRHVVRKNKLIKDNYPRDEGIDAYLDCMDQPDFEHQKFPMGARYEP